MFGIGHSRITFESHLERLSEPIKPILVDLRKFVKSLGSNVIEEIRLHRIVYSKTLNFRIFLDIEPTATTTNGDSLRLSIRYGKGIPSTSLVIMTSQDVERAKKQIADAYHKIQ
ncbi:MAG: hypothetical protein M3261_02050 [Thermoproteota archaeon]|nr:hypothetical protein [Thermoproteota archaeon]